MNVALYGRRVSLPDFVELPLVPAPKDEVDLVATVGTLPNAERTFALDRAVNIHVCRGAVAVEPQIELGPRALEHYLVDHAVPNGLTFGGDVVVHAAGASLNGKAVLLLGKSGQGKSTLSWHLANAGWQLMGDDSVRLELRESGAEGSQLWAWPSYSGVRLHTDVAGEMGLDGTIVAEYADKLRVAPGGDEPLAMEPVAVAYLCVLGETGETATEPIGPAARCAALSNQTFMPPEPNAEAIDRLELLAPYATAADGLTLTYERTTAGATEIVANLDRLLGA